MITLTKVSNTLFTNNKELKEFTLKWFIYWLAIMSCYSIVMRNFSKPNLTLTLMSLAYFIISITICLRFFKTPTKEPIQTILLIIGSLTAFCFIVPLANNISPLSKDNTDYFLAKGFYYPLLYFQTSIIKACDICFQQIMIYSFIQKYLEYNKSKSYIVTKFSVVFFIIHVPLFILFGWLALLFIIPSLTAGIMFSYLILNMKRGILYSFLLHQLFYITVALSFRF